MVPSSYPTRCHTLTISTLSGSISTLNITEEQYQKVLDSAPPDHMSEEFLLFLKTSSKVILETPDWLVVENIKYHTEELPWYTAFAVKSDMTLEYSLQQLQWELPEYKIIIHPVMIRSVKRFHVHLIRVDKKYIV